MAKKRKTRQQKIIADLRHNFNHPTVNQAPFETKLSSKNNIPELKIPLTQIKSRNLKPTKIQDLNSLNNYSYLVKDLSKTGLLTIAILSFQVILFLLLKNHTLIIPGLNY